MKRELQPLDYALRQPRRGVGANGLIASFLALAISVALTIWSFSNMDSDRLFWEGGSEYFQERFPFGLVIGTAFAGAVAGLLAIRLSGRWKGLALLGALGNIAWSAWWLRSYLR